MNDANPRRHYAEGGPDDESDPYAQQPYYQQQYAYDAYGRPVAPRPQQQVPPPAAPQQQAYADPYYADPYYADPYYADPSQQAYPGQQQGGWIPQQPYYEQSPRPQQGYGTDRPADDDTGRHPGYDTGQHGVYDTGRHPGYDTGQHGVYETGRQAGYDTGQQPVHDTGQHAVQQTGREQAAAEAALAPPGGARAHAAPPPQYQTEQFAFVDEESEESDEVIDWLKFSESRTERREEAKRRGRNRKAALVVVLVLAMLGGAGYLWRTGALPGLSKKKSAAAAAPGGSQKRGVIVVHLLPVSGGPSATALLVDNETKGRGTTVLIPNSLSVTGDDGAPTTLEKSVGDGVGPTRDALNNLLGTDIKGSWRLDSPYLELLVDSIGDVFVDTDTAVKATTGKEKGKTLAPKGRQQELNGQAAVAYATYRGPGEAQTDQLSRFGQVMQAVLKKLPSDPLDATRTVQSLSQILDPSLTDKQLGASLARLAQLAKTGAYDTATLPVQKDGTLGPQATDSVVKDVLGGSVKQQDGASAQARVQIKNATGSSTAAAMAQAAIVNGGTYTYVAGSRTAASRAVSQVLYGDPARLTAAKDVAATLGLPASAVRKGTVPSNADIEVVLAKDYKPPTSQ